MCNVRTLFFLFGILIVNGIAYGQIAERAFINGKIYTANDAQPFAEAFAFLDDEIIYVGTNDGVQVHIGASTTVADLEGRLVLPGMHDVHMHPLEASSSAGSACYLDYYENNINGLAAALEDCDPSPNSNGWITAYGHSFFTLLDSPQIPRLVLDNLYPDIPVAILESTSHSVWVNSKALELANIGLNTPDPIGGHIMRLGNNQPTGILLDNAGEIVMDLALASTPEIDQLNYEGLVDFGLPLIARNGITSACEARTYWKRNYPAIWEQVKEDGALTCRMILAPWVYPEDDDIEQLTAIEDLYDEGDDMLRITQVKLYTDGITINATAALHEPYNNNLGFPFNTGLNYIDANRLQNYIEILELVGYDFHMHAIGDRGTTEALDAVAYAQSQNGDVGARHRITHLEIVDESDYLRFAELGVIADAQVAGVWTQPPYWQDNAYFVGPDRADNMIPLKSLYDAGAHLTLSSDWDVSSLNPFRGIQNALTRAPQELPNREEAVKAYTIKGAYVMQQEENTGSLEVGKWADFICVDQDVFTIPVGQIAQTQVLSTWVGGEEVWRSDVLPPTSTTETEVDLNWSVSPNPVEDLLRVEYESGTLTSVEIYKVDGEFIQAFNPSGKSKIILDISQFQNGIYLLKARLRGGQVVAKKIVKE